MRYQIIVNRKLESFGQFVTEGRDEINTTIINGEERPFIFGTKLRAVERRTIMKRVREVLGNDCCLKVHEKTASGISGLCMSCPACYLFGGTYAPKTGEKIQVNERTKVNYSEAYPFVGGGIQDVTFNAVDEQRNITGQALGVNQIIKPRDFINVVDVETDDDDWVKLLIWGIEHSTRYGANVRIYGQMRNEILGIIRSDVLELTSYELVHNFNSAEEIKRHIEKNYKQKMVRINIKDKEIDKLIKKLQKTPEVKELAKRKKGKKIADKGKKSA
ncbi:MAG: type I-D CRISPR-associated protein Cas7/Csc2 [Candidatus Thermoplasmatota archaeon]